MIAQIRRQQKKQKQSKNIRLSNTPRSQAVAKNDTVAPNIASTFYIFISVVASQINFKEPSSVVYS